MKNSIPVVLASLLLLSVRASATRSPAGPAAMELSTKKIQCTVAWAQSVKNGELESSLDPAKPIVTTCNQFGGPEYDDAMCFVVKTLTPEGKESALGFGCIPLNDERVRSFDGRSMRLYRSEYSESIDIDFVTGLGQISYEAVFNDWGRRTRRVGTAYLVNCRILSEPAKDCAAR